MAESTSVKVSDQPEAVRRRITISPYFRRRYSLVSLSSTSSFPTISLILWEIARPPVPGHPFLPSDPPVLQNPFLPEELLQEESFPCFLPETQLQDKELRLYRRQFHQDLSHNLTENKVCTIQYLRPLRKFL